VRGKLVARALAEVTDRRTKTGYDGTMISHRSLLLLAACTLLSSQALAGREGPVAANLPAEVVAQRKAAAKIVLVRWLAAQNKGDFDGYLALYAPRFRGVRRSRLQTVRLDRSGWAKDRSKMFAKPMTVEISDLQIFPGKAMTKAQFTQRWSSGSYSDVGPKRIMLVEDHGTWLIAEEEMLASHAPTAAELLPATVAGRFAFVVDGDVVLASSANLCDGPSSLEETMSGYVIRCPVKPISLPKDLDLWRNERVTLYTSEGTGCTTRLSSFEMVGRVYIMQGMVDDADGGEGVSERARHKAIWGESVPLLVGKASGCGDGSFSWARVASLAQPIRAKIGELEGGIARSARRAFRDLPGWSEAETQCARDGKSWEKGAEEDHHLVSARFGTEQQRFAVLAADTGDCGDACGSLFGLFRIEGRGKQTTFSRLWTDDNPRGLLAAFDSDGDGQLEFLWSETRPELALTLWIPDGKGGLAPGASIITRRWLGCGC
jgi:hypothetical protein